MQCYSFLSNYYARLFEVKKNRGILRIKNRNDGSSFLCSTDFQINRHTHKRLHGLGHCMYLYELMFFEMRKYLYMYINDRFLYSFTSFHHGWQQHSLVGFVICWASPGLLAGLSWQNIFNKTFLQYAFTLYVCRR